MPRKFLTPIDHAGLPDLNRRIENVASLPAGLGASDAGREVFLTTNSRQYCWTGSGWLCTSDLADALAGASDGLPHNGAWYQNRANGTGTAPRSSISDFDAGVLEKRLDQFATPTADVGFGSRRITSVATPTAGGDGANKQYVDDQVSALSSGMVLRGSVRVATSPSTSPTPGANISVTAPGSTIDGVTMQAGDWVLLANQTTKSQNGPWVWNGASSAMTRPANWANGATAPLGAFWSVREGTNADLFALCTTDTTITVGTTATDFLIRGNPSSSYAAGNGLALAGTTFSVQPAAGGGIAVAPGGVSVDTTVQRVVKGLIPASSAGIFSISGAVVTIAHGLANLAARLTVRYGTSPGSGNTQGALLEVEETASDSNNIVVTLPSAPAANQYAFMIEG